MFLKGAIMANVQLVTGTTPQIQTAQEMDQPRRSSDRLTAHQPRRRSQPPAVSAKTDPAHGLPLILPAGQTMSGEALAALILASAAGRPIPVAITPPAQMA